MSNFKENLLLWYRRATSKYRLILMNENTFEERISIRLSPINVYIIISFFILFFSISTYLLIAFTPLKQYIPGYGDFDMQERILSQRKQIEILEKRIHHQDLFVQNLQNVLSGKSNTNDLVPLQKIESNEIEIDKKILEEDKALRKELENDKQKKSYNLKSNNTNKNIQINANYNFLTPVNGFVTSEFSPSQNHNGIDIVTKTNEIVKATLDGVVIISSWSLENGNVVAIQHKNNIISMYKHNSKLLKKVGNTVKSGEAIAVVGNTGELSKGPHLHFELWQNGNAVNPRTFINFN
jgi:murein DD-endopeptidase MepM/ murein hydrolase activator NlpD